MNRAYMLSLPWPALWLALAAACGDTTTTPLTELNLDRPVDVSFACYGTMRQTAGKAGSESDMVISTAMPTAACESLSQPLSGAGSPVAGQETINGVTPSPEWYAFILQSAAGTVAVTTWTPKSAQDMQPGVSDVSGEFRVLDADPLTPGKNAISIGEDPVAIATDQAGCFEVTANAGSCDLSELEINTALDDVVGQNGGTAASQVRIDRVPVTKPNGDPILSKPAAMVGQPGTQTVGNACPTTATGQVYIAYPSCHMVAGIDLATGKLVSAISFDATGAASIVTGDALNALSCPNECPSPRTGPVQEPSPGVRPVALDYRADPPIGSTTGAPPTTRLAIGLDITAVQATTPTAPAVTVVDLDVASFAPKSPPAILAIPFEHDTTRPFAATSVAVSLRIGMGGNAGNTANPGLGDGPGTPEGAAQFVYAVVGDGTVRVAEVLNQNRECDTQIDGRFLQGSGVPAPTPQQAVCMPIGDPNFPRRVDASGPGIKLPGHTIPTSVAIVKGLSAALQQADPTDSTKMTTRPPEPAILVGHFAIVTSSTGAVFVVNIDDDYAPDTFDIDHATSTAPVLVMPHQLRDRFINRDAGPLDTNGNPNCTQLDPQAALGAAQAGGPRPSAPPDQSSPTNTLSTDFNGVLPRFQQVPCNQRTMQTDGTSVTSTYSVSQLEFGADAKAVRSIVYPDLKTIQNEAWTVIYEGTLSVDTAFSSVDGPQTRDGRMFVDGNGMRMVDDNKPFCAMGVEPFDTVDFRGCNPANPANSDGDCPAGYTCFVHPKSNIGFGTCMLKSEAPRLTEACQDFMTSLRRYTVGADPNGHTAAGSLILLERQHDLPDTPVHGCESDDQCNALAKLAAQINPSADPFDPASTSWRCQTDKLRAPVNEIPELNKRCVQSCTPPKNPGDAPTAPFCATGTICRPDAPGSATGICMEGVEPPQACVNGPQRYDVRGSEAFVMIGATTGYIHPFIKDTASDACVVDPKLQDPEKIRLGRVPLRSPTGADWPTCAAVNPYTGVQPNPCSATVDQFDNEPTTPGNCEVAPPALISAPDTNHPFSTRQVPALRFRTPAMSLTLVDAVKSCQLDVGDPQNPRPTVTVPLAVTGYTISFTQKAGLTPALVPVVGQVFPIKVVRGPTESIWVIDYGDVVSNSFNQASTKGRVFRVESVNISLVNTMQ
jgi:hypothetical protein